MATVAAILRDLRLGATLRATAAKHRVSVSTVARYRDAAQLMVRHQQPAITSARWQAAVQLVADHGLTVTEAARRMGVSQGHLSRRIATQYGGMAALRAPIRQQVAAHVAAGRSYYETARVLDMTENRVKRYAEQAGVRSQYAHG
jgi:DNA-binding NarL/FixJ family response regulator